MFDLLTGQGSPPANLVSFSGFLASQLGIWRPVFSVIPQAGDTALGSYIGLLDAVHITGTTSMSFPLRDLVRVHSRCPAPAGWA